MYWPVDAFDDGRPENVPHTVVTFQCPVIVQTCECLLIYPGQYILLSARPNGRKRPRRSSATHDAPNILFDTTSDTWVAQSIVPAAGQLIYRPPAG